MLDLKELLISFDRHLITCLIANQVQATPLPTRARFFQVFSTPRSEHLTHHRPPGTDDAPPFLHHPEIYGIEFWHAHLNYACTRFAASHGSDRLLGNQICHWTTGTSETCLKVTHLVVFLPPALGAYVLSQHVPRCLPLSALLTMYLCKMNAHSPDQPELPLNPSAVIKHQSRTDRKCSPSSR